MVKESIEKRFIPDEVGLWITGRITLEEAVYMSDIKNEVCGNG